VHGIVMNSAGRRQQKRQGEGVWEQIDLLVTTFCAAWSGSSDAVAAIGGWKASARTFAWLPEYGLVVHQERPKRLEMPGRSAMSFGRNCSAATKARPANRRQPAKPSTKAFSSPPAVQARRRISDMRRGLEGNRRRRQEHKFVRADRFAALDDVVSITLNKGRQLIDEQGDRLFKE
jgi:hypothetical protein